MSRSVTPIGSVGQLRRHPVKSMLGERIDRAVITPGGLERDRDWALINVETGMVASAKQPRLWRDLLRARATVDGDGVRIGLPDGTVIRGGDPDADDHLSAFLGRRVRLTDQVPDKASFERADPDQVLAEGINAEVDMVIGHVGSGSPEPSFVDFAPIHLVTSSTIAHIGELGPDGDVAVDRYRPNIVIDADLPGFAENDWPGTRLRLGDDVVLEVIALTPRCAVPTLAHGELPRDTQALRVAATHNRVTPLDGMGAQPCVGAYATVRGGGTLRLGDAVTIG
ncbi:MAG TPA: MOSC N-terminal beta barrel domain-containing protein [Stackebrandtia sp.]|jgi:uncharacterized protein YcbX|uniref:MOSC domain-containing protein n=1 Tax=Stackebrandtia sp. TaxID=2023065 RepID=UPI002D705063|nr:MOSC N-terminal beta barrel domain-containing protein [Stackebrandtia sp.]HZE37344.1 MOSC N-terminal beta barrel domain-containing protein [Stackebrandtia sp.]